MATTTTTYSLSKPTVGGDDNAWGTEINNNLDKLDDLLDGTLGITPNLATGWEVGGVAVTSTAAELNVLDGIAGIASQVEAEAGTATDKLMTPERTKQAVEALATPAAYEDGEDATTSGTAHDFTGIPAGINEIDVFLDSVSISAAGDFLIQIGSSGAPTTSGYFSFGTNFITNTSSVAGFVLLSSHPNFHTGSIQIRRIPGTNKWVSSYTANVDSTGQILSGTGYVTLAGDLDTIRLTRTGVGNFDAGSWSIRCRK